MSKNKHTTQVPENQLSLFDLQPQASVSPFDAIRHADEDGRDYWLARELMDALEYTEWRNFQTAIKRAKQAIDGPENHFVDINKMVDIGSDSQRQIKDIKLSRRACYLVSLNGDPDKPVVKLAQNYFIDETYKQELAQAEQRKRLAEKRGQAETSYYLKGKSMAWAKVRVDSKESQKYLNATLHQTHEQNHPDYAAIANAQNEKLFDMTRAQIVSYLGLLPKDEPKYRDFLGKYALEALDLVSQASSREMARLHRGLTDEEQLTIVRNFAQRAANIMKEAAEMVGIDYLSGEPLDGQRTIGRNQRLLG